MSLRSKMRYMNPYDIHKALINEYILKQPGDTRILNRDTSKDRTDADVLKLNHKFLWEDDQSPGSWEAQFAKKYYDKLFKEYCIGDLTFYKENKIALRWRIENEVVTGKGQFVCGNKKCQNEDELKTWEVNFAYHEQGEKKNALVKIRLCPKCSIKLNYRSKKREVKRLKNKSKKCKKNRRKSKERNESEPGTSSQKDMPDQSPHSDASGDVSKQADEDLSESPWDNFKPVDAKSRDEEMEDYLQDLLL